MGKDFIALLDDGKNVCETNVDQLPYIFIQTSKTADTRSCDCKTVDKQTLYDSSVQHIGDVKKALDFIKLLIDNAALHHDHDKLTDINGFYSDFSSNFTKTEWYDKHRKVNRHHLNQCDGIPYDLNLVDVLEMLCDCVMAGMGRSGEVYPIEIDNDVLQLAVKNTVELLKAKTIVE